MKTLYIALTLAVLASCSSKKENNEADALVSHIDSTVKPGDDFFMYANNGWFKKNPIPASEMSNGLWQMIDDTINAQIRNVCESAAKLTNEPKGSAKQKIGDFFYSGMDSVSLNNKGITDLQADMERIEAIKDKDGLVNEASYLHAVAGAPMLSFGVGQDDRISDKHAVFIFQGGLSLPDRRFYFDTDDHAKEIRSKFVTHLENMYAIIGYDSDKAKKAAANTMALETAIAKVSRPREALRDPLKNYNKITFKQLTESTPNFNWVLFTNNTGLKNVDTVIVGQPEFLSSLNDLISKIPLSDWKDYLKYHLIHGMAPYLDDKTFIENFNFYATVLRGVPEPRPRWKRVVAQTDDALGELIGQVYVSEYLPKGTKEKLMEIGKNIQSAYADRIKSLDWMSEETKQKALSKLSTVIFKVGYPDKWKDLSALNVDRSSYVHNMMSANKWSFNYMIAKYGKPVDRTEWGMYPQTYNAYYNPSNNEICVPGCNILVPGYEHKLADDAILYAMIGGSTFGHELTHGFDDQGSKYDEKGNLNNWWTPEDSARFYAKTRMVVRQYDEYIAVDSLHINGDLTQGENIADIGGLMMGYDAFKKTEQYKKGEKIAGLTPDQRFFLGYALAWMVNMRPEAIASQVRSNEHSPTQFRVIGPVSSMPEFYAAFGIKEGDKMWRPDSLRARIW